MWSPAWKSLSTAVHGITISWSRAKDSQETHIAHLKKSTWILFRSLTLGSVSGVQNFAVTLSWLTAHCGLSFQCLAPHILFHHE